MEKLFLFRFRFLTVILLAVVASNLLTPRGSCYAQGSIDHSFNPGDIGFGYGYGASSHVYTTSLQSDGKIIIGGAFTSYNLSLAGRIARLNADGTYDNSFNPGTGANGTVNTTALQIDGKILIGGYFQAFNGTTRRRIARLNADGSLDTTFNLGTGANSNVWTTALQSDGKIIIGGEFTTYNGTAINRIARLNADGSLDTTFNPGTGADSYVRTAAIQSDGKIIIGGNFINFNGTTRRRIARLNTDGSIDNSFNQGTGADDEILTITIQSNGKIIIGGEFAFYNGTGRSRIARLNANGTLDTTFNPGSGAAYVSTTTLQSNGKIIIGGWISSYNGTLVKHIARLNVDGSLDTTFNSGSGTNHTVSATALQSDGKILIGGYFSTFNGTGRNRIARLNTDGSLDITFNPGTGANNFVRTTAIQSDGKIIIGGDFTTYNGTGINRIARLNVDGSLDTTFNQGAAADHSVFSTVLQSDGKIIIVGSFASYNGIARQSIARLNTNGSLDTTFNPGSGAIGTVWTTALQPDGKIIIGGQFTFYNGVARNRIARLNADGSLDTTFNTGTGVDNSVYTTTLQPDGKIIIGGTFTSFNGTSRNYIARINTDGSPDTTFNPGTGANGHVWTTAIQSDGKIIIGGTFLAFNGTARNRLARLNVDGSLDTTFNPGTGAVNSVYTTALQPDGKIIIGGNFSSFNGTSRNNIARINTDGSPDTTFNPGTGVNGGPVYTAALQSDGKIIIGGTFTSYDSTGRNRIARILNCTSAISYDVHTACNSFTWMNGITYTSSNNTAVYNIVGGAANGCDSVVMLNLTINAPTVTITALGNVSFCQGDSVMLAAQSNAITHQWYRNGVAIPNATGTTYVVKTAGRYRCIGNISSTCSDTSNIIFVSVPCTPLDPPVDRIMQNDYSVQHVVISPNPATHTLSLKFDFALLNGFELELLDLYGKLVLRQYFQNAGEEFAFSLPGHIANGMYICRITTPETNMSSKVIVER